MVDRFHDLIVYCSSLTIIPGVIMCCSLHKLLCSGKRCQGCCDLCQVWYKLANIINKSEKFL